MKALQTKCQALDQDNQSLSEEVMRLRYLLQQAQGECEKLSQGWTRKKQKMQQKMEKENLKKDRDLEQKDQKLKQAEGVIERTFRELQGLRRLNGVLEQKSKQQEALIL